MTERLIAAWQGMGAKVTCIHDFKKTGLLASALLPASEITTAARFLLEEQYFIEDLTGTHVKEGLLVTYHFDSASKPGRVALRVLAEASDPHVPSIARIYQGAEWHERETFDFFGIIFDQNPNLVPLLLDTEHQGPPPLLKEEKALASVAALGLFSGEVKVFDPAWQEIAAPVKKDVEAKAAEGGQA